MKQLPKCTELPCDAGFTIQHILLLEKLLVSTDKTYNSVQ